MILSDTMYISALALAVLPLLVQSTNVVLSNDDGWAEINIRAFYSSLTAAGDSVVLSAPAENESGTGSWRFPVSESEGDSLPIMAIRFF